MSVELYIGTDLIDLAPGTKIATTFQASDLSDIESQQGNFTNTFKAVLNKGNKQKLGFPHIVPSASIKPYRKNEARVVQDGLELPPGFAVIEGTDEFIDIVVYSGNVSFFDQIDGLSIQDLDMSDLDHTWIFSNVLGSFNNTEGIIYALIDYGFGVGLTNREFNIKYLMHSVFIHTIVQRIVEEQFYTLDGDMFDLPRYKKQVIPFSGDMPVLTEDQINLSLFRADHGAPLFATELNVTQTVPSFFITRQMELVDDFTVPNFDNNNNFNTGLKAWVPQATQTAKLNLTVNWNIVFENLDAVNIIDDINDDNIMIAKFIIEVNGVPKHTFERTYGGANVSADVTLTPVILGGGTEVADSVLLEFEAPESTYNAGDIVTARITVSGNITYLKNLPATPFGPIKIEMDALEGSALFNETKQTQIQYGSAIDVAALLPDISQTDFIKLAFQEFGAIVQANNVTQEFRVRQYSEILGNLPKAKNWSDKVDKRRKPRIEYRFGNYGQNNHLKYKEDDALKNRGLSGLGDGSFAIDDTTLPLNVDLFVLPVAATEMIAKLDGLLIPSIPKIPDIDIVAEPDKPIVMSEKVEPRILFVETETISGNSIIFTDGNIVSLLNTVPMAWFIRSDKDDNLGFDDNVIDLNYPDLIAILTNAKKVTQFFLLDQSDISELDHFIPIYVDDHQHHFYLNLLSNYINNLPTEVELIRL